MLGKLMKYEFKATGRIFLPLFGALLIVAVFNRIFSSLNFKIPQIIGTSISVIMIVSICVIALILTIQRFSRNLLSKEGYLMFTLPVSTDGLIWSKLLVASIWSVISMVAVFIAIAIMAATGDCFQQLMNGIREFIRCIQEGGFNMVLLMLEGILLGIASLFSGILLLYACMALSLFVNKHRVGFAFLMYIAFSIIGQTITSILATTISFTRIEDLFTNMSSYGQIQTVFGGAFLWLLISGGVFYILTRYMLKNRLNLE
jgi:hypothetical protein